MGSFSYDITMPSLGADMTEGTLVEWLVTIGDKVNKGDIVAVIETQKGAIDMEIYQQGIVSEILVEPDTKVPVGTVLARLTTDSAVGVEEAPIQQQSTPLKNEILEDASETIEKERVVLTANGFLASPVVRRTAQEWNLDLSTIKGSGPSGAILLRDLEASFLTKKKATRSPAEAMRQAIANAMEKSKKEIPHYYITLDIDISDAQNWLQQQNANKEPEQRILLLAVLLKAVALALKKYPQLNGFYRDGVFQASNGIHIGSVISLREGGLMVPAIHDVDQLSLNQTMDALRDITNRSREGHLRSSELSDTTITVTSMGERGSDSVLGIIYPPQVAIVGFGKPRKASLVKNGQIEVCDIITASLGADHRVSDGIVGAKFLNTLAKKLVNPEKL